jgi:hypothetical protein
MRDSRYVIALAKLLHYALKFMMRANLAASSEAPAQTL